MDDPIQFKLNEKNLKNSLVLSTRAWMNWLCIHMVNRWKFDSAEKPPATDRSASWNIFLVVLDTNSSTSWTNILKTKFQPTPIAESILPVK